VAMRIVVARLPAVARLTPTERRVCELAAGGETSVEIAQELLLTERAVEDHFESACRKLGVGDRSGLFAAIAAT